MKVLYVTDMQIVNERCCHLVNEMASLSFEYYYHNNDRKSVSKFSFFNSSAHYFAIYCLATVPV